MRASRCAGKKSEKGRTTAVTNQWEVVPPPATDAGGGLVAETKLGLGSEIVSVVAIPISIQTAMDR